MSNIYAVAAAHREDLDKVQRSVAALGLDKDKVVVVANGENPIRSDELPDARVLQYPQDGFNLSAWWNYGIDYVRTHADEPYEIFVFNADCFTTFEDLLKLAHSLRLHNLSVVGPDQGRVCKDSVHIEKRLQPVSDKQYRLPGYAFMLEGESGIRMDENIRFWYNDDDLEWTGRSLKGVGLVRDVQVDHPYAGNLSCRMNPTLHQYANEDREYFFNKWGNYPH